MLITDTAQLFGVMNERFYEIRDHTDRQEYVENWAKAHPAAAKVFREVADIDELMDAHAGMPAIMATTEISKLIMNHSP